MIENLRHKYNADGSSGPEFHQTWKVWSYIFLIYLRSETIWRIIVVSLKISHTVFNSNILLLFLARKLLQNLHLAINLNRSKFFILVNVDLFASCI